MDVAYRAAAIGQKESRDRVAIDDHEICVLAYRDGAGALRDAEERRAIDCRDVNRFEGREAGGVARIRWDACAPEYLVAFSFRYRRVIISPALPVSSSFHSESSQSFGVHAAALLPLHRTYASSRSFRTVATVASIA